MGVIELVSSDYPTAKTEQPKVEKHFAFAYKPEIGNGDLIVVGSASNLTKSKSKSTEALPIAKGLITTSRLVQNYTYVAYADHGYDNREELVPTSVEFFFEQGKSVLRSSEKGSHRGKDLDAFIAQKNVTRTVTIVGNHSPEGSESKNTHLANDRASVIQHYTVERMKHFNYKGAVDSIKFVTKGVVLDWELLKKELAVNTTDVTPEQSAEILAIVNGPGSFEEKEKQIEKLSYYKKTILGKVYPKCRVARTEILTVKKKKSDAEIRILAAGIADGSIKIDTLNEQELAYAGTLTPVLSEKEAIYKALVKKTDNWVAYNNLGAVYLEMAKLEVDDNARLKLLDLGINNFQQSIKRKDNAEAHTNLASSHLLRGVRTEARTEVNLALALPVSDDVRKGLNGILGVLDIKEGKYDLAIADLAKSNEDVTVLFNYALAYLLKKDFNAAKAGFEKVISKDANNAWAYYGAAVTAARMKDEAGITSNLSKATKLNKKLVDKALGDLEFQDYWNSENFKNALK